MALLAIAIIVTVLAICILVFAVVYWRRRRRHADAAAERLPAHESHGIVPTPESSDQSADTREVQ